MSELINDYFDPKIYGPRYSRQIWYENYKFYGGKKVKVAFTALIREIKNKSLVSGDKTTRVTLEFDSNDKTGILNNLNELHRADELVTVVIMDKGR